MPRVVITFDTETSMLFADTAQKDREYDPEYQVVMDMKASHYKNIKRNLMRFNQDQKTLLKFFIETQQAGRPIREQ